MKENSIEAKELQEALAPLTSAVRSIAHGDISGPGGLEAVSMAIAGERQGTPLSESVVMVAEALGDIAMSIEALAVAIQENKGDAKNV